MELSGHTGYHQPCDQLLKDRLRMCRCQASEPPRQGFPGPLKRAGHRAHSAACSQCVETHSHPGTGGRLQGAWETLDREPKVPEGLLGRHHTLRPGPPLLASPAQTRAEQGSLPTHCPGPCQCLPSPWPAHTNLSRNELSRQEKRGPASCQIGSPPHSSQAGRHPSG